MTWRGWEDVDLELTWHASRKPPLLHFKLDFGKALGSAYTAKAIRLWLDPFLRETLAQLLVWPNRLLYPILPESVTGPLDFLQLRSACLSASTHLRCLVQQVHLHPVLKSTEASHDSLYKRLTAPSLDVDCKGH